MAVPAGIAWPQWVCPSWFCCCRKRRRKREERYREPWLLPFPHPSVLQFVCWLLNVPATGYSVSQGRICSDNCTCCHTEIEVADQTFYLTQSLYTDTGPTSPSTDPIAWVFLLNFFFIYQSKVRRTSEYDKHPPRLLPSNILVTSS